MEMDDLTTRIWLHKYKNEGGGGPTPTGTIQITTNGEHNVTSYATADVQVPTIDTSDANAIASDIAKNKTAYVKGQKITGTMNKIVGATEKTAQDAVSSSGEYYPLVTVSGPVIYDGVSITVKANNTALNKMNIIPENIKKDVHIMGVTGTYEGGASEYNGKFATQLPVGSQYNTIIRYVKETPEFNLGSFTSCSSFFSNCDSLERVTLFDISKVTTTKYMFQNCIKLIEIPQFNTSRVTDMGVMFSACESLVTVPILDTHLVSPYYMNNMFQLCTSLSDESLNNILYMCANCEGTGSAQQKTLYWIGLNSTQATKCTTLSNWSACTAKGWTTGY